MNKLFEPLERAIAWALPLFFKPAYTAAFAFANTTGRPSETVRLFRTTICLLLLFAAGQASAQDIHFAQFYQAPLNLNPALTGVMNASRRLAATYRAQWQPVLGDAAYRTAAAAFDQRVPIGQYDFLGLGINLWGDQAGQVELRTTAASLSGAYSKRLGGHGKYGHYLSAGFSLGLGQTSLAWNKLRWGTQFSPSLEDFDQQMESLESLGSERVIYPDFGAGLLWFLANEKASAYAGGAISHLTQPSQSLRTGEEAGLPRKFTLHAGGEWAVGRKFWLVPNTVGFVQAGAVELNGGLAAKFSPQGERGQFIQAGTWLRLANRSGGGLLADAMVLAARFETKALGIGFSYDLNTSPLRKAGPENGAWELSLAYKFGEAKRKSVWCPDF